MYYFQIKGAQYDEEAEAGTLSAHQESTLKEMVLSGDACSAEHSMHRVLRRTISDDSNRSSTAPDSALQIVSSQYINRKYSTQIKSMQF